MNAKSSISLTGFILVLMALIVGVGILLPARAGLAVTWGIIAAAMLGIFVAVGLRLGKGPAGALIDPARNMMSLSRFQVVLWTWLILSAFVTVALARVWDARAHPDAYIPKPAEAAEAKPKSAEPLGIQLPALLWALMGVSVASSVLSPLLLASKAQSTEAQDEARRSAAGKRGAAAPTFAGALAARRAADPVVDEKVGNTPPAGAVLKKSSWDKAEFSDLFTGEEVLTFGYVDIAKLQNFFFTVIAAIAYAMALVASMSAAKSIASFFTFPEVPAGLLAVISISHTGYLVDKPVVHSTPTPTASPPPTNPEEPAPPPPAKPPAEG